MAAELTAGQIARLRLQTLSLVNSKHKKPVDAVRNLLAMQAQDFGAAQWAVGLRVPGSTAATVAAALKSGQIVRSWPMRGTLHFVAAEDLNWILQITTERLIKGAATRRARLGLDDKTLEKAREIAIKELSGGRQLSREELMTAFQANGIDVGEQRSYHFIWHLSQTGTLCWGPPHKTKQALVLLNEWVPKPRVLERDEALGEFVLRYFSGHGPATLKDFMWWTKVTSAEAKIGLAVAKDQLVELKSGDKTYWMDQQSHDKNSATAKKSVLALPAFDEHLLGYQDRSHVLPAEHASSIVPGQNGMFLPTIVHGGEVVGTWKAASAKGNKEISYESFGQLSPQVVQAFNSSIANYKTFLGRP